MRDFGQRWAPIILAQAIGLGCGLVGVRLVSQWIAPADYGIYGVFTSLAPIGATVVYAGLVKFLNRNWRECTSRPRLLREVFSAMGRKAVWLAFACGAIGWVVAPDGRVAYMALLFASAMLLTVQQFAQTALQSARQHWRDLGIAAATAMTRAFGPPLLYVGTTAGVLALLSGYTLYALVGATLGLAVLRPWLRGIAGAAAAPSILTPVYEGPRFVVLAVAAWTLAGLNRWLVTWRFGAEIAGYFTLASNIGSILPTMLGAVLLQYYQPVWFAAPAHDAAARRRLFRAIDWIALAFTGLALAMATGLQVGLPRLVGVLIDARYIAAAPFVLATTCSATAIVLGTFYHAGLIAVRRERDCTAADLSGAAILVAGALGSIAAGFDWFTRWLVLSPVVPWIANRTFARRAFERAEGG